MIEEKNFQSYLYISKNKYQIFVYDQINLKNLYNQEVNIKNGIDSESLSKFLDENIYKIEKTISNFIKNIILIIEDNQILNINIAIKQNIYEKPYNQKYLENNLKEIKDIFRKNYKENTIMHMIMVNNSENEYKLLLNNQKLNNNHQILEVSFISISNKLTLIYDKILANHQIKIDRYMSGNYIKSFFGKDESDIIIIANKLFNGLNKNEITLISKNKENKGFFEKFFQLFS